MNQLMMKPWLIMEWILTIGKGRLIFEQVGIDLKFKRDKIQRGNTQVGAAAFPQKTKSPV